jgi:hypothetical protein
MATIARNRSLDRRYFLKGIGTCVALPFVSAMIPAFGSRARAAAAAASPPRFVAMNAGLGFLAAHLFPKTPGRNYELTPYLEKLKDHRKDFTVFSGLSHQNQNGANGHTSEMTWLTSAQRPGLAGFKNTISLDQLIARHVGAATRFPFLVLTSRGGSLSWTANGVQIPSESSPSKLFAKLFLAGTPQEVDAEIKELERGKSILDTVLIDAKKLNGELGPRDKQKLDEYFTSLRDLEARLKQNQAWARKPKPKVDYKTPKDVADKTDVLAKQRLMYDMIALAIQTDSCRSVTFQLGALSAVPSNIPGVKTEWHNLSHHGKDDAKINELKLIEQSEFVVFNEFLTKIKAIKEGNRTLLDRTAILYGSNLGNASSHSWRNLPIILAGGGYKHGSYVAHDQKNNTPLANMFVSLAQRMGVETDTFGMSTSAGIKGLEV